MCCLYLGRFTGGGITSSTLVAGRLVLLLLVMLESAVGGILVDGRVGDLGRVFLFFGRIIAIGFGVGGVGVCVGGTVDGTAALQALLW